MIEHKDLIIEREYGSHDWQQYNKRIWNQIYITVPQAMLFENFLYNFATRITDGQYSGGSWEIVEIKKGGFYFRPVSEKKWNVESMAYQSTHEMSSDGFGLAVSMLVYTNYQSQKYRYSEYLTDLYHYCRDLAFDDEAPHPENDHIFRLID